MFAVNYFHVNVIIFFNRFPICTRPDKKLPGLKSSGLQAYAFNDELDNI